MTSEDLRPLTEREREIIERLLSVPFPGRDELLEQARHVAARTFDAHGCIELVVSDGPRASVDYRIPVNATISGPDGFVKADLLLHVVDGYLTELELAFSGDDATIIESLDPSSIQVLPLD